MIDRIVASSPGQVIRAFEQWKLQNIEHASLNSFLHSREIGSAVHSINVQGDMLDVYVRLRPGAQSTIVFFNGAVRQEVRDAGVFPIFSGIHVSWGINCNVVCFDDPSLRRSPDVGLAWYVGSEGFDLAPVCAKVIRHLAGVLGSKRIILFGGSNGGFAALNIGRMIPGAATFCINPQTDIGQYGESATTAFARACFAARNFPAISAEARRGHRMNLCEGFLLPEENFVFYVQNYSDRHLQSHALPFIEAAFGKQSGIGEPGLHLLDPRFLFFVGDWGEGHAPPPKPFIKSLLSVLAVEGNSMRGAFENLRRRIGQDLCSPNPLGTPGHN